MNKGREEVNDNDAKQVRDDAVTLQARNSIKTSKTQDNAKKLVDDKINIQSYLQEPPRTKTIETMHYNHVVKKDTHEERRLQIEELDQWRAHKPRTHDKSKLRQNKPDTSPNQLKVGDKVLLDVADPHIITTTPNEEIPLTVLSIFPFDTVEVSHPKFGTFKGAINLHGCATWPWVNFIGDHGRARNKARFYFFDTSEHYVIIERQQGHGPILKRRRGLGSSSVRATAEVRHPFLEFLALLSTDLWEWFFAITEPTYLELTLELCYTFHLQVVTTNNDNPGTIHFRLDGLVRTMSVPEFGVTLGLYNLWEWFFAITEPTYLELTLELCYTFHLQVVTTNNDNPGTIHFRLDGLVRTMSVPEFGVTLGLYTNELMEEEDMNALPRNIHISPSLCWKALAPLSSTYDPSHSKASALAPSLRYLHVILAQTLTARRESTGVVNTHDPYYLWCIANAHVIDLAYFIAFAIRHQTERHRKGGITTMLHMRMIKRRCGTDPPQHRLSHAIDEKDLEDILDDVPPQHEELSTAPPRERPIFVAASLAHLSD
ncbi:hypothetical protein GOBAR_AA30705 [Gossypium barbadense]|uniref:Uncharacterized protein n=1 Tax=Gossypium barbadense TaxID=3634 RepID=A0A2P5WFW2_GOSBA|nr:hypothetical protein GOBAR_AA30705 [Gossypium barbadense]